MVEEDINVDLLPPCEQYTNTRTHVNMCTHLPALSHTHMRIQTQTEYELPKASEGRAVILTSLGLRGTQGPHVLLSSVLSRTYGTAPSIRRPRLSVSLPAPVSKPAQFPVVCCPEIRVSFSGLLAPSQL